jgi:hypothetical protein
VSSTPNLARRFLIAKREVTLVAHFLHSGAFPPAHRGRMRLGQNTTHLDINVPCEGGIGMTKRAIFSLMLFACALYATDANKKSDKPDTDETQVQQSMRRPRIRLGGIVIGAGYSRWSGGWCCGYPGYGYYGWGPSFFPAYFAWEPLFYHPYYGSGFVWGPNMGEVKLHSDLKDAEVFLDGAYAGTVSERKSMWLDPGAYNLEVRALGKSTYAKRIYVLSGKSLRIKAKLEAH